MGGVSRLRATAVRRGRVRPCAGEEEEEEEEEAQSLWSS